eukprot:GILJ01001814.1.p1 GENE.GILJ01001814.1~~GILJ01001814.1.p1  ORF type:complete len:715 (-),score=102.45 GILJ01001814.1:146-2290(-)
MKFSKQIEYNAVPEWREYYIKYKALKRIIKKIIDASRLETRQSLMMMEHEELPAEQHPLILSVDTRHEQEEFMRALESDLSMVDSFYTEKEDDICPPAADLAQKIMKNNLTTLGSLDQLRNALHQFYLNLSELRNYAKLNAEGFRKIVKKYDKSRGTHMGGWFNERIHTRPFFSATKVDDTISLVQAAYARLFTRSDIEKAKDELSEYLHDMVIYERNTVWRDMLRMERRNKSVKPKQESKPLSTLISFFAAVIAALILLVTPIPLFDDEQWEAQKCLSLMVFVSAMWALEIIPLYVTSFLVPFLVVTMSVMLENGEVMPAAKAASTILSSMAGSVIFLILGGFTMAAALSKHRLDKDLATAILSRVGQKPGNILLAVMLLGCISSMWISNVAGALLSTSVIMPLVQELPPKSRFIKALLLGCAYSCNIGGMTTPIASPQNAIALDFLLKDSSVAPVSFIQWVLIATPTALVLTCLSWAFLMFYYRTAVTSLTFPPQISKASHQFTSTQWFVIVVNVFTVLLWCLESLFDTFIGAPGVIGLIPVVIFFGCGVLNKEDFNQLPWHVVYLVAGGSALGTAVKNSKLLDIVGSALSKGLSGMSMFLVLFCLVLFIAIITSCISHTVGASILIPMVLEIGKSYGHPRLFVMAVAMQCSGAMALPVSGFPNVNSISILSETGAPYLNTKDFLKTGGPLTILVAITCCTLGYGIMTAFSF